MSSARRQRRSLAEVTACCVPWVLCMGLTVPDAHRVRTDANAAIAEAVGRGKASLRNLLAVVWGELGPVVRDSARWDWHRALHQLTDVPVGAAAVALTSAACAGVPLGLFSGSVRLGVLGGTVAAAVTVLLRGVRGFRREIYYWEARRYQDPKPVSYWQRMRQKEARWRTVPNVITVLRLPAAALVVWLLSQGAAGPALLALVVLVASDLADGWIARVLEQETRLGRRLDPAVDRAAVAIVAVGVVLADLGLPLWVDGLLLAVVVRVTLLLGGGLVVLLGGHELPRRNGYGKAASILEFCGLLVLLGVVTVGWAGNPWALWTVAATLAATVGFGVTSVCLYAVRVPGQAAHVRDDDMVPVPPDVDPYSHVGILSLLGLNPFSETLAAVYEDLLRHSAEDSKSPLDMVDLAITEAQQRLRADLPPGNRPGEREYLLNLKMLRAEVHRFQQPADPP